MQLLFLNTRTESCANSCFVIVPEHGDPQLWCQVKLLEKCFTKVHRLCFVHSLHTLLSHPARLWWIDMNNKHLWHGTIHYTWLDHVDLSVLVRVSNLFKMSIPFDNWNIHPSAHIPVLLGGKWSLNRWTSGLGQPTNNPRLCNAAPEKAMKFPVLYAPWGRVAVHSIHWKLVQTCNMIQWCDHSAIPW